jgi:hypothetical protein
VLLTQVPSCSKLWTLPTISAGAHWRPGEGVVVVGVGGRGVEGGGGQLTRVPSCSRQSTLPTISAGYTGRQVRSLSSSSFRGGLRRQWLCGQAIQYEKGVKRKCCLSKVPSNVRPS